MTNEVTLVLQDVDFFGAPQLRPWAERYWNYHANVVTSYVIDAKDMDEKDSLSEPTIFYGWNDALTLVEDKIEGVWRDKWTGGSEVGRHYQVRDEYEGTLLSVFPYDYPTWLAFEDHFYGVEFQLLPDDTKYLVHECVLPNDKFGVMTITEIVKALEYLKVFDD